MPSGFRAHRSAMPRNDSGTFPAGGRGVDRDMDDRHRRALGQQQRDPVAPVDAALAKGVRQAIGAFAQAAVGERGDAPIRGHIEDGRSVRLRGGPAVADIDPDVVALGDLPAELGDEGVVVGSRREHGPV